MDVVTGFITSNSMVSYLYIYRYTPMDNPFYWYLTTIGGTYWYRREYSGRYG